MNWFYLGCDDVMFAIIIIVGIFVINFWLRKIYNIMLEINYTIDYYVGQTNYTK